MRPMALPSYDDLPVHPDAPPGSSWGVWAEPGRDVLGCLNLLTPERIVRAASLIRTGRVFALNLSMDLPGPPLFGRASYTHEVTGAAWSHDDLLHGWNTQSSSQWDGFRHVHSPVHGPYGGVADGDHGIHHWVDRIVGRAVLADVGRHRAAEGRPLDCSTSDPITPDDVQATLDAQGTTVEEGDVLLLRTGWLSWYRALDDAGKRAVAEPGALRAPGLTRGEPTARFLWDLHISAVAADNPALEVWPIERLAPDADQRTWPDAFVHTAILPLLGLPIGELFDLDALAEDCAADGRYESFFTSAPLNLPNGVASPPNALAIR